LGFSDTTKFFQSSTSELFGQARETPQNEQTPFHPRSPYGVAKLYAHWITVNYREAYGLFASNGILFNHESPIRGETFVTRKITRAAVRIALGMEDMLYLGNLDATRDWGHAQDFVRAMWLVLQHQRPEDFVIATGVNTSIREFVRLAFKELGITLEFTRTGIDEVGIVVGCENDQYSVPIGKEVVQVDPRYFRPSEVENLTGDASKARELLGWSPKHDLGAIIAEMIALDLKIATCDSTDEIEVSE
jgi:GDPmannose 4,6-dehydratase